MKMTLPSNRHFGLLFTIVFAVLSGLSFLRGGGAAPWLDALSLLTGLPNALSPAWLQTLQCRVDEVRGTASPDCKSACIGRDLFPRAYTLCPRRAGCGARHDAAEI